MSNAAGRLSRLMPGESAGAVLVAIAIGILIGGVSLAQSPAVYDIVIAGGRVIDPDTKLDAVRNVGIKGDRIIAVSASALRGKHTIDAKGLVVAPGFIDLHAHGQTVAADRMQAFDGVTTSLELESGVLPIGNWYESQAKARRVLNYGASVAWTFARIAEFENISPVAELEWFQKAFSLTRWVKEPAAPERVSRIVDRIAKGLDEGGIGIGINAGYAPGAGFAEFLDLHKLAARRGVPTFTHISCSFPSDPKSASECIGQVIALAATTGAQTHICHLNSSSGRIIETTANMIQEARKRGVRVTTEAYTYGASSTVAGAELYSLENLKRNGMTGSSIEHNGERLNDDSFTALRTKEPGAVVVAHFLDMPRDRSLLDRAVLLPGGVIASDSMPWGDKRSGAPIDPEAWPLPETAFAHPRSAGTFTGLLARWVRERKQLSLSDAIWKASLGPAKILEQSVPQMRKKGRLQAGMDADLIVFDPSTVQDRATFTRPAQTAVGMRWVIINGSPVIADGQLKLDARPGKPVRREIAAR